MIGADIEKKVCPPFIAFVQDVKHFFGTFPFIVKGLISPCPVQRDRGLHKHVGIFLGQSVVGTGAIIEKPVADAVVHKAVGLIFTHHVIQLAGLRRRLLLHRCVKPYKADVPVPCQELLELRLDLSFKAYPVILFAVLGKIPRIAPVTVLAYVFVILCLRVSAAVLLMPIKALGIIQPKLDIILSASSAIISRPKGVASTEL